MLTRALVLAPLALPGNTLKITEISTAGHVCRFPTELDDVVRLRLGATSPELEAALFESSGQRLPELADRMVEVTTTVGKFNVRPLNQGLLGMCPGDRRLVSVTVGAAEIVYDVELLRSRRARRAARSEL